MEKCKTCKFWKRCDGGEGCCRRYPPVPVVDITTDDSGCTYSYSADSFWPFTNEDHYCGEYRGTTKHKAE